MNPFLLVEYLILGLTFVCVLLSSQYGIIRSTGYTTVNHSGDVTASKGYLLVVLVVLSLVMGLRGNISTDYLNYIYGFQRYRSMSLGELVFSAQKDPGFAILEWLIGRFTDNSAVLFVILAAITVFAYLKFFKSYSPSVWMSVILLLCIGNYYMSANMTRQIMVGALFGLALKYVMEEKLLQYIVAVLLLATMHQSAIVMLPLYFFLKMKWKKRTVKISITVFFIVAVVTAVFSHTLVNVAMNFFYQDYSYGIDNGLDITSIVKIIAAEAFILYNYKKIDMASNKERCLFNASLLYSAFYICAINVMILYRFAQYFAMVQLVLIPMLIHRIPSAKTRLLANTGCVTLALIYSYWSIGDMTFLWYWQ